MKRYEKKLESLLGKLKDLAETHHLKYALWVEDNDETWVSVNTAREEASELSCTQTLYDLWSRIAEESHEAKKTDRLETQSKQ